MSTVTISFECHKSKLFNNGHYVAQVGRETVSGETLAELKQNLLKAIEAAMKGPTVAMARIGDEVRVIVEHAGNTDTFVPDSEQDGVVPLRCTCSSNKTAHQDAESAVMHLCQQAWNVNDAGFLPKGLPASKFDDFISWENAMLERLNAV